MEYPITGLARTQVRFNTNARKLSKNRAIITLDVPLTLDMNMAASIGELDGKNVLVRIEDLGYPGEDDDVPALLNVPVQMEDTIDETEILVTFTDDETQTPPNENPET